MRTVLVVLTVTMLCPVALAAPAAGTLVPEQDAVTIPRLLSYQGKLTDTMGIAVADTTYSVNFRLYTQPTGGSAFWNETQTVRTKSGLFSVLLGTATPIGSMPDAGAVYLGMAVAGGSDFTPRLRIASAAYAYLTERAANADLLQGRDTTTFSRSNHNHDAAYVNEGQANAIATGMMRDTAVTMAKLAQAGASTGQVVKWTGTSWAPGPDNTGGGTGVTNVYQDTGIICVPNPITSTGNVKLNLTYSDGRYVNEAQANSVTGAMITDGQVSSADIRDTTVNSGELKDAAVTAAKLNQMGASTNQVLKWTGSVWAPRNDSIGGGSGDNAWARGGDSVLYTIHRLGIARGQADNMLYGSYRQSHTNFGVACTTGLSSANNTSITLSGGYGNLAQANYSTVGGGLSNRGIGVGSIVAGGYGNVAGDSSIDTCATVAGGYGSSASAMFATVGGGKNDTASGKWATVGGGSGNRATGDYATVTGGWHNRASQLYAAVGGGSSNQADGGNSIVGAGSANLASGEVSAVVAGYSNSATNGYAFVGGGSSNEADRYAVVCGGEDNVATGQHAVIGGGFHNEASGANSVVPGGSSNYASGRASFAAGMAARARHNGCFVWSDSVDYVISDSLSTTGVNQWRVRARGGAWFYSNLARTTGAYLASGSNSWASACDSMTKEDFRKVDRQELLEKVASLRVQNYKMKDQDDGTRHIGPVAQEFHSAFGVGEDNTHINMADADGVLLAAVQALYEQSQSQQAEIEALKAELKRR